MSYSLACSDGVPLDLKMDALFGGKRGGFFIELGAYDGLTQSNTAFFEFSRGWTGVLVEPSAEQYTKCVAARPKSHCFNYACVSDSYTDEYISGDFTSGLMSSVTGRIDAEKSSVPAKPLGQILDSIPNLPPIDFISLDVEGYEQDVLEGLDLEKYRPRYMLIEVYKHKFNELSYFLDTHRYSLVENMSMYNHETNPIWDGSHNDYLFSDDDHPSAPS
jgi:FkbM family methyltransferase